MGKHKITPEEEAAYRALARAARRLREAQEAARRERERGAERRAGHSSAEASPA